MQITEPLPGRSRHSLDRLVRYTASALITVYQKQISPRKGFSCAHRVLYGSESCSQYTKRILSEHGVGRALPLIRQRFQDCKAANQVLKARLRYRSNQQQPLCSTAILPTGMPANAPSWQAGIQLPMSISEGPEDDAAIDDGTINSPDENTPPPDTTSPQRKRVGGGSFRKPPITNTPTTEPTNQNNCADWNCDPIDCASMGCDAIDCSSADCSGMDCSAADWQGLDCSGFDCSSLDCSSCDVSSCDVSSCDVGSCDCSW